MPPPSTPIGANLGNNGYGLRATAIGIADRSHALRSAWQAYEVRHEAWLVLHAEMLRRHGEEAME